MQTVLENAQRVAELAQERVGLMERLAEIEQELVSAVGGTTALVAPSVKARTGRPPGKSGGNNGIVVMGGKRNAKPVASEDDKGPDLPTLLAKIASEARKPLKLAEFVQLARESGYNSDAKDFSNMVYQALLKLVKRGVLEKDQDNRDYHYVGKAA